MKTAEDILKDQLNGGLPSGPVGIFNEQDIGRIQRDAYRQGLVDAANAQCWYCLNGIPVSESLPILHRPDETGFGPLCGSTEIRKLIAAHDKVVKNEAEQA